MYLRCRRTNSADSERPGSARISPAGDCVPQSWTFPRAGNGCGIPVVKKDCFGETPPKPTRETRALPGILAALLIFNSLALAQEQPERVLRVAADPNNLPFSNERLEGFENKIADLIAHEMHAQLQYEWRAQRRGFFRETLKQGDVNLVLGVPSHFDMCLTTAPYYRSSYVFVSRKDRHLDIRSFDDPQLRELKIGVQLVGNDGRDTPPAHALAARGIIENVRGFTLYGDYTQPNPPARIIDAVANGDIDLAVVWGPLAGYFANRSKVPLELTPLASDKEGDLRFAFDVSLGVKKKDESLKKQLDKLLFEHREEIDRILANYNIPRVDREQRTAAK